MASRFRIELVGVLVGVATMALPGPASAGRLLATGHDVDCHSGNPACTSGGQAHFLDVAVSFVRHGAPDPAKPVLVLSCYGDDPGALDLSRALDAHYSSSQLPRTVMCPSSEAFTAEPLTTSRYSAILVGSSCGSRHRYSLNGVNCEGPSGTTPDSDALSARKREIAAFFNEGGGILALSGRRNGDGDPSTGPDTYYDFLPLGAGGSAVAAPFRLTDVGEAIGLEDAPHGIGVHNDINCCETHNSFAPPPSGSALQVAERDRNGKPETLVAAGAQIAGGDGTGPGDNGNPQFVAQPDYPGGTNPIALRSNAKCVRHRRLTITIKQPRHGRVDRVDAFVNAKRKKRVVRRRGTIRRVVLLQLPRRGRYRVRIDAWTTNLTKRVHERTYRACDASR